MKLKIGHLTFQVRRMTAREELKQSALGMCCPNDNVILIRRHTSATEEADTFIHEVLHAMHHAYRVKDRKTEEETCNTLAGPLLEFLSDNPWVVSRLIAVADDGTALPIPDAV